MSDAVYIYTLSDPETFHVRYVGKTLNLKQRMFDHMCNYKNGSKRGCHRHCWIQSVKARGLAPVMEVLEETTEAQWQESEKFWIENMRFLGFDLVNGNSGGIGGARPSMEARRKISAYRKTFRHTEKTKSIISEKSKANMTPKAKAHLVQVAKSLNFKHSDEAKRKISESKIGKPRSPEVMDKLWASNIKVRCLKNHNVPMDNIHRASLILGEKIPIPNPKQAPKKPSCREVALARPQERKDKFIAAGIKSKALKGWHVTPVQIEFVQRVLGETIINSCPDDGIIKDAIKAQSGEFTSSALYAYAINLGITRTDAVSAVLRAVAYGWIEIVRRGKGMRATVFKHSDKSP